MIPDRTTLLRLLGSATRIPSGDNCQPWSFQAEKDKLIILHDESRGRHALNRKNHASLISLGCLAEGLSIASSVEGLRAEVTPLFTTEPPELGKAWAEVRFRPSADRVNPLVVALINRCTDRSLYKGGDLCDPVFRDIASDAVPFADIEIRMISQSQYSQKFLDVACQTETCVWTDEKAQQDLMRWIRFSDKEVQSTRDGMPWRTLGISYPESRILKLCRSFATQQLMNKAGFLAQSRKVTRKQILSSAGILAWVTHHPSAAALYAVGRLSFRAWLRLVKMGYAAQPMTLTSLSLYDMATGALDPKEPAESLLKQSLPAIQEAFSMGPNQLPVWMLRTGLSEGLPPETRCLRLPVESILS